MSAPTESAPDAALDPAVPAWALTLWRPWPWVMLHGGKSIENRPWTPPASMVGRVIALHAGKVWDGDRLPLVRAHCPGLPADPAAHPLGIVGVARLVEVLTVEEARARFPEQAPWIFGPWCWRLAAPVAIPAVPVRGAHKLWRLPPAVRARVGAALAAAGWRP